VYLLTLAGSGLTLPLLPTRAHAQRRLLERLKSGPARARSKLQRCCPMPIASEAVHRSRWVVARRTTCEVA